MNGLPSQQVSAAKNSTISLWPIIKLKDSDALDFDDLISHTLQLLADHPRCWVLSQRFRHVHVDEYQDTNAQYSLVRLLTQESRNLCVGVDTSPSTVGAA